MLQELRAGWAYVAGSPAIRSILLLLALLRESVKSLLTLVGQVWSSAVGVFVHTVTTGNQLARAEASVRALAEP